MLAAAVSRGSERTPGVDASVHKAREPAAPRRCGSHPIGNQARLRGVVSTPPMMLQAKLAIGAVDDPLEREADRAADQVMRMADPAVSRSVAASVLSRKCAACASEDEEHAVRRLPDGVGDVAEAPPIVGEVLRSPGRPLDAPTHAHMAARFGADFSDVRIHTDSLASQSAAAVAARAYTVGNHVVFGAGHFDPAGQDGRRLIAHELAHTLQQGGGTLRRAPCRTAAQCAGPNPGDTGRFVERISAQQAANAATLGAAPPGSPNAALLARNGQPATNVRALLTANGVALQPEVFGFFINPSIGATAGAQTNACSAFPAPGPVGAPPTKQCVQVPAEMEDQAQTLVGVAPPGTPAQREAILTIVSTCVHEMEHAHFNDTQAATMTAPADCTLNTLVFHGPTSGFDFDVKFYLSEIAAITSEFKTFFENSVRNPGAADQNLLFNEERQQALNPDESFGGLIRGLQCVCSCSSVTDLVVQTVNLGMSGWAPPHTDAFLRAMTRIIPTLWPAPLRRS